DWRKGSRPWRASRSGPRSGSPRWRTRRASFADLLTAASLMRLLERQGGGDEAHMGESLREVAKRRLGMQVEFLRIKPDVAGITEQLFEQPLRLVAVAQPRKVVHQPEAADAEQVLAAAHTVVSGPGRITEQQAVHAQFALDEAIGADHARIARLQKAVTRHEQQACVGHCAAVVTDVGVARRVVGVPIDVFADRLQL